MTFLCTFLALALTGCATLASSFNPQVTADVIAQRSRLTKQIIPTRYFNLTSYYRGQSLNIDIPSSSLTVYIEGDGRSWLSKYKPAPDPTPFHPTALELAELDTSANLVYLGRPCQYDGSAHEAPCAPEFWMNKRFSEEVIQSTNEAIDFFVKKSKASKVNLIGYSGGGAVAVLVAARRQDVATLRTVAGNLDPKAVTEYQEVSPLDGSLDPLEVAPKLSNLPQRHFVGSRDTVVPPFIAENFQRAAGESPCVQLTTVPDATHHAGWVERWEDLSAIPISC